MPWFPLCHFTVLSWLHICFCLNCQSFECTIHYWDRRVVLHRSAPRRLVKCIPQEEEKLCIQRLPAAHRKMFLLFEFPMLTSCSHSFIFSKCKCVAVKPFLFLCFGTVMRSKSSNWIDFTSVNLLVLNTLCKVTWLVHTIIPDIKQLFGRVKRLKFLNAALCFWIMEKEA